ncbi:MAG: hypothetical protein ACPIOQ_64595, partial [Promethearchaeia archaeon]
TLPPAGDGRHRQEAGPVARRRVRGVCGACAERVRCVTMLRGTQTGAWNSAAFVLAARALAAADSVLDID